jgi:hypothetical protein
LIVEVRKEENGRHGSGGDEFQAGTDLRPTRTRMLAVTVRKTVSELSEQIEKQSEAKCKDGLSLKD